MLSDTVWSFSKVAAYCRCPLSFKLQFIDRVPQEGNAFSEYGTLCHSLLDAWAKGELLPFELADAYAKRYNDQVQHYFPSFPPGVGLNYYKAGLRYFKSFEGFGEAYEIIASEERVDLWMEGVHVMGILDLLLRHKDTGELVAICHKSKSLKEMKKELAFATRQLYLYAAGVEGRYGQTPSLLRFNMLRSGSMLDTLFCARELEETKQWLLATIARIKEDARWDARPDAFYCEQVCSSFPHCHAAKS